MGIFDYFKAKPAPERELLPSPNYLTFDSAMYGRGNGNLLAMLSKKLPSSNRDWRREAGDLSLNSIVAVCTRWYLINYNQVDFKLYRDVNGQKTEVPNEVINLIKDPMPGTQLPSYVWGNYIQDYLLLGNAYLRKIRGVGNSVIALEYLPADCIRPKGNDKVAITEFVYTASGQEYSIKKENIIHWRFGRDTEDIRLGRSPITSLLREIAADNQASSTAYGLIKNGALPSIILGPDASDVSVDLSPDDLRQIKDKLRQDFSGDQSGGIAVMSGPYKMDRVSYSPSELDLSEIRRLPEQRIPAALGLNALVLGLGAGLDKSSYNNYQQAQSQAYEDGLLPLLDSLCEALNSYLLIEFNAKPGDYIDYDVSGIKALKEDEYQNAEKAVSLYSAGIISRADAKRMVNLEFDGEDESTYFGGVTSTPEIPQTAKSISFKYFPTAGMKETAARALKWKEEGFDGGTRIGLTRANQIVNGDKLSEDTILRMYSFFSRHEVDKRAPGFNSGEEGFPSNGRVAWDLWGGDAGFAWSSNIREKLMNEGKNISISYTPEDDDYNAYQ